MTTQIQQPLVLVYTEINIGKYTSTRHYKSLSTNHKNSPLTELLNISKDRNCAKSMPNYWVQVREHNKWKKPRLTGLFKTQYPNIYKGDISKRKHLLLVKFLDKTNTIIVYYFENYHTTNIESIIHFIN